jgi:hypothetical protein
VLQRELILPDDIDPAIRMAAIQRWDMLGQQAQMKMQVTGMPGGMPPSPMGPPAGGQPMQMDPSQAPTPGMNAGVALQPQQAENLMGASMQTPDENTAMRQADQFTNSF